MQSLFLVITCRSQILEHSVPKRSGTLVQPLFGHDHLMPDTEHVLDFTWELASAIQLLPIHKILAMPGRWAGCHCGFRSSVSGIR